MSGSESGIHVPLENEILRLPSPPKDFVPDRWLPTHLEFQPTTFDEAEATRRDVPVRVSVWDATLTTVDQARAFRRKPTIVLSALAGEVVAAGVSAVVYDPLDAPENELAGAAGHAGIEGLIRAKDEPRVPWRARLQRVANCFRVVATP